MYILTHPNICMKLENSCEIDRKVLPYFEINYRYELFILYIK